MKRDDEELRVIAQLYEAVESLPPSSEYSYVVPDALLKLRKFYLNRKKLRNAIELAKEISYMPSPPENVNPEMKDYFNVKYTEDLVDIVDEIDGLIKKVERYANEVNEDLAIIEGLLARKCGNCEELKRVRDAREAWSEWLKKDLGSIMSDGKAIYEEVLRIMRELYSNTKEAKKEKSIIKRIKEFFKGLLASPGNPPEEGEGKQGDVA